MLRTASSANRCFKARHSLVSTVAPVLRVVNGALTGAILPLAVTIQARHRPESACTSRALTSPRERRHIRSGQTSATAGLKSTMLVNDGDIAGLQLHFRPRKEACNDAWLVHAPRRPMAPWPLQLVFRPPKRGSKALRDACFSPQSWLINDLGWSDSIGRLGRRPPEWDAEPPCELSDPMKSERTRWGRINKAAGVRLDRRAASRELRPTRPSRAPASAGRPPRPRRSFHVHAALSAVSSVRQRSLTGPG
jgi:hypothetical protein